MSVTTVCVRCQSPLEEGTRFCPVCGLSSSGEQTAPLPTLLQVLRQATLGEYEILQEIGQGGMATVYLAHEIALDRKVAVKVMSPQFVHGAEMIERFKREARLAASLNHPHIIPIYAVRESQQVLFFVMKYIAGRSLDTILRDVGPLPFPMVRSILADVGAALDYAHRQGVVHRDVKPGNIMIDDEGFAVITDFGIAKAAEGESLTRSGTTVGTPSYLSPEACAGDYVGPAADQYSLGIVGYEMITGQLPFSADSSLGMMYAQVHNPPRPSEQLRPDCPPDLRDAVMRMLEKSPTERFLTMRDAAFAISGGRTSGAQSAPDDHVRSHIGMLAVPRPGRPIGEVRRTPASPMGLQRIGSRPSVKRRQKRVHLTRVLLGLFLAALGATAAFLTLRQEPVAIAPPESTPAPAGEPVRLHDDSVYLGLRGAAIFARQQAVLAGATALALQPGDSLFATAESLAAAGRPSQASLIVPGATTQWAALSRPVQPAGPDTPRVPRPTLPTGTQAPPATTESPNAGKPTDPVTPALSDSLAIVQFYRDLESAIESRQLGEVSRLLPNLSQIDEGNWRGLFEDRKVKSIEATFDVRKVSRETDQVHARVWEQIVVTKRDGKIDIKNTGLMLTTLTLGPSGWREILSEKLKQ